MKQKHLERFPKAASGKTLPVSLLIMLLKFVHGTDFPPVYWLQGNETVITGQVGVNILVKLNSPCEKREVYTIFNKTYCELLYDGGLLLQLKSLCETTTVNQLREKENTEKIEIVSNFQPDLLSRYVSDETLLETFNHYRYLILKQQRTNGSVMNEDFLSTFTTSKSQLRGLSLTDSEDFECSMQNGTQIDLRFTVNKAKHHLKLLNVRAFYFLEATENEICRLTYNGTKNVIWSLEKRCVTSLDFERLRSDLVKVTGNSDQCLEAPSVRNREKPYFNVSCEIGVDKPEIQFVQAFKNGDIVHVYCKGKKIQIRGVKWNCPSQPFSIRATDQFSLLNDFNITTGWSVTREFTPGSILSDYDILTVNLMVNPEELNITEMIASYLASPDANISVK